MLQGKKKRVTMMVQKSRRAVQTEERRLAGSLPARIGLLVLTRTMHTPPPTREKKEHGRHMRATSEPGVIERFQTSYSHLSTHAKSSCKS